jgi:hypothetical protein
VPGEGSPMGDIYTILSDEANGKGGSRPEASGTAGKMPAEEAVWKTAVLPARGQRYSPAGCR